MASSSFLAEASILLYFGLVLVRLSLCLSLLSLCLSTTIIDRAC